MIVEALDPATFEDAIPELAALIVDSVESGSAVNFLAGATVEDTAGFWRARRAEVETGATTIFVARDDAGHLVGCTMLARSTNQNSPHRAEIGKVIVARAARRQGLGRALMAAAEERARAEGRWLLILDTETGSPAAALYESMGWQRLGDVPEYALTTDGALIASTFYWKDLR